MKENNVIINSYLDKKGETTVNININNDVDLTKVLAKTKKITKTTTPGFNGLNFDETFEYGFIYGGDPVIKDLYNNTEVLRFDRKKLAFLNKQNLIGLGDGESQSDAINYRQFQEVETLVANNQTEIEKNQENIFLINQGLSDVNFPLHASSLSGTLKDSTFVVVSLNQTLNNYSDLGISNNIIYNQSAKKRQELSLRVSFENVGMFKLFELYFYKLPIVSDEDYLHKSSQTLIAFNNYINMITIDLEENSSYQFKYFLRGTIGKVQAANGIMEISGIAEGDPVSVVLKTSQLIDDSSEIPDAPINQKLNQILTNQIDIADNSDKINVNIQQTSTNTINITNNATNIGNNSNNITKNLQDISQNSIDSKANETAIIQNANNLGNLNNLEIFSKNDEVIAINEVNTKEFNNFSLLNLKIQVITDESQATETNVLYLLDGEPIKK